MPRIVPLVEGHGDMEAVPVLIRRILWERLERWEWHCDNPIRVGGLKRLYDGLERYLRLALLRPDCGGVLILLDLEDGCPKDEACCLADRIRNLSLPKPVAIVFAHREYEAWFLASVESLTEERLGKDRPEDKPKWALPAGVRYEGDPEEKRGAKEWLSGHMPKDLPYEETQHQAAMTAKMDMGLAYQRSRSFRRLIRAVEQIVSAEEPVVTPDCFQSSQFLRPPTWTTSLPSESSTCA